MQCLKAARCGLLIVQEHTNDSQFINQDKFLAILSIFIRNNDWRRWFPIQVFVFLEFSEEIILA
jgi:hypothetical protein